MTDQEIRNDTQKSSSILHVDIKNKSNISNIDKYRNGNANSESEKKKSDMLMMMNNDHSTTCRQKMNRNQASSVNLSSSKFKTNTVRTEDDDDGYNSKNDSGDHFTDDDLNSNDEYDDDDMIRRPQENLQQQRQRRQWKKSKKKRNKNSSSGKSSSSNGVKRKKRKKSLADYVVPFIICTMGIHFLRNNFKSSYEVSFAIQRGEMTEPLLYSISELSNSNNKNSNSTSTIQEKLTTITETKETYMTEMAATKELMQQLDKVVDEERAIEPKELIENEISTSDNHHSNNSNDNDGKKEKDEKQQVMQQGNRNDITIARILYFNSVLNPDGYKFMEGWLQEKEDRNEFRTHRRIEIMTGSKESCHREKTSIVHEANENTNDDVNDNNDNDSGNDNNDNDNDNIDLKQFQKSDYDKDMSMEECLHRSSISRTYDMIKNTYWGYAVRSGYTLVLHGDDIIIPDMSLLYDTIKTKVRPNWQAIWLDCDQQGHEYNMTSSINIIDDDNNNDDHHRRQIQTNVSQTECVQSNGLLISQTAWGRLVLGNFKPKTHDIHCHVARKIKRGVCLNMGLTRRGTIATLAGEKITDTFQIQDGLENSNNYKNDNDKNDPNSPHHSATATATDYPQSRLRPYLDRYWILEEKVASPVAIANVAARMDKEMKLRRNNSTEAKFDHKQKQQTEEDERKERKRRRGTEMNTQLSIDRIYYANLAKNTIRRQSMELWLQKQPIPYRRVDAQVGEAGICVPNKNTPLRCKGISGIAKTWLSVLDDPSLQKDQRIGAVLLLEDDIVPILRDLSRLEEALAMVPNDWDVIRFDCWGGHAYQNLTYVNKFVYNPYGSFTMVEGMCEHGKTPCPFCGGGVSMLIRTDRTSSIEKVKRMWNQRPLEEVDCGLAMTSYITTYCVQVGIWNIYAFPSEESDISGYVKIEWTD